MRVDRRTGMAIVTVAVRNYGTATEKIIVNEYVLGKVEGKKQL